MHSRCETNLPPDHTPYLCRPAALPPSGSFPPLHLASHIRETPETIVGASLGSETRKKWGHPHPHRSLFLTLASSFQLILNPAPPGREDSLKRGAWPTLLLSGARLSKNYCIPFRFFLPSGKQGFGFCSVFNVLSEPAKVESSSSRHAVALRVPEARREACCTHLGQTGGPCSQ